MEALSESIAQEVQTLEDLYVKGLIDEAWYRRARAHLVRKARDARSAARNAAPKPSSRPQRQRA